MEKRTQSSPQGNPLGTEPVGKLLLQFALPAIISTLIGSLYNMVDQVFIGQRIGYLGNAATTVAYPLTFLCGALTLLFSNGSVVNFNILNGRGEKDEAMIFAGNGLSLIALEGLFLGTIVGLFTPWFVDLFGATEAVFPYALTYMHEYMLLVVLAGIPPISMHVMTSVGKAGRGIMISLSRQLTLIVLLLFLPLLFGINGVLYAGPCADVLAAVTSFFVLLPEFRAMRQAAEQA